MTAEQHREEGLRLLEKHDYIMAGWEFIHAIDAGDIPSYGYLGQLLYEGGFTADLNPDVNGAIAYWKTGMEAGDERCRQLFMEHKDEMIVDIKKIVFENGDRYKGDVNEDGLPHGTGHMDYNCNGYYAHYDGQWVNGERSGKGHYHRSSKGGGACHIYDYKGDWLHDKEHGQGVARESDETGVHLSTVTEIYTGGFREGKRHGHGVIEKDNFDGNFTDGQDRFEGNFVDGKTMGHGIMEYANGDRFEGEFDGYLMPQGHGVYTFRSGLSFQGEWKDGDFVPESLQMDQEHNNPALLVTEHHHGFDYSYTGTFLIPAVEKGVALYENAATIRRETSFNMREAGINILDVTPESVTVEVRSEFTSDSKPLNVTLRRGETRIFESETEHTATIYDEDYDYTIGHSLKVSCR